MASGVDSASTGRAGLSGFLVSTPAAIHPHRATFWPNRIGYRTSGILVRPIRAEPPDIAMHVAEPKGVRQNSKESSHEIVAIGFPNVGRQQHHRHPALTERLSDHVPRCEIRRLQRIAQRLPISRQPANQSLAVTQTPFSIRVRPRTPLTG